jgi:ubiquinone/menaquinone biosynthesis C-methylase UbiE
MQYGEYMSGAPHLSHETIRILYNKIVHRAYGLASLDGRVPTVLDLGAGDGIATISFLSLGAHVTAVDISSRQLEQLRIKCSIFNNKILIRCADVYEVLNEGRKFDIIVANSFLHHIPDYMHLLRMMASAITERGIIMTFQDPMLYKSCSLRDFLFTNASYFFWRIRQKEVLSGLIRKFRRNLGIYNEDSIYDNTEYHVVRNGVNQLAIQNFLSEEGLECFTFEYGSFMSDYWQKIGDKINVKNTFAILATKNDAID